MQLMPPVMSVATMYSLSDTAKTFGLLGGFPDDEKLLREIKWCQDAFGPPASASALSSSDYSGREGDDRDFLAEEKMRAEVEGVGMESSAPKVPTDRLVALLDALPLNSRNKVASQILAQSPLVDEVKKELFDYCFEPREEERSIASFNDNDTDTAGGDDDFVLLWTNSTRSMDTRKYHIMAVVLILLRFGRPAASAQLCRSYVGSASTRHLGPVLAWCAQQSPDLYSDRELWEAYRASPGLVQKQVLVACKANTAHEAQQIMEATGEESRRESVPHPRHEFLELVWNHQMDHDPSLVFWCTSEYLSPRLDDILDRHRLGFCRWSAHSKLYLSYMKEKFLAEPSVLKRGDLWKNRFEPALPKPMGSEDLKWSHVHALAQLLVDCQVYQLDRGAVPENVQAYLQDLAAAQDANVVNYQGVEPVTVSKELWGIIPKKERVRMALDAVDSNDWEAFERYRGSAIGYNHMPFEERFRKATIEDLWNTLCGKLDKKRKQDDAKKFLSFFASTDFTDDHSRSFTIDALWEWLRWHLRSAPSHLTPEQQRQYYEGNTSTSANSDDEKAILRSLWTKWYDSLHSRYFGNSLLELTTSRVLKARREHRAVAGRSRITLDARYAHELLDIVLEGIRAVPMEYQNENVVLDHLKAAAGLLGELQYEHIQVVENLNAGMRNVVIQEMLPRMGRVLKFDPTQSTGYVSPYSLNFFRVQSNWLVNALVAKSVEASKHRLLLKALLTQVLDKILTDASADHHNEALPNSMSRFVQSTRKGSNQIQFVFYDSALHQQSIDHVVSLLEKILVRTKEANEGLREEQSLSWQKFVEYRYGEADWSDVETMLAGEYLDKCKNCLPTWLLEEKERKVIMERSIDCLKKSQKEPSKDKNQLKRSMRSGCLKLHKLDLLAEVLEQCNEDVFPDKKEKGALLLETGSFQYGVVRESLKAKTSGIDADQRTYGQEQWLRAAFETDLPSIAEAIEFTVGRIRNESGLQRRKIYDFLAAYFPRVVRASLEEPSQENLDAVGRITNAITEMLRSDLNRRDSVGWCLKGLPSQVIQNVVSHGASRHDALPLRGEIRQAWVSFSIKFDWMRIQASSGEQGLLEYKWPLGRGRSGLVLDSCQWISATDLDAAYPRPQSFNLSPELNSRFPLVNNVKDGDLDKEYLGPHEFVGCMTKALDQVWTAKFSDDNALCWKQDTWVSEDESIRNALAARLSELYRLCDLSWQEVPLLVETFDRAFANLEAAPKHHFKFASDLLETVIQMYSLGARSLHGAENSQFYLVARLAKALDQVFRYAVDKSMPDYIVKWCRLWSVQMLQQASRDWEALPVKNSVRFLSFLAKYTVGCEPPMCKSLLDKTDRANRKTVLARELLAMSTSALWRLDVRETLLAERPDILEEAFEENDVAEGPFAPQSNVKAAAAAIPLYDWLDASVLGSFTPELSRRYADLAVARASNPNLSITKRVEAIENFCTAPSTGHQEVLQALQKDLEDPIREAMIIKVFSLDSPWHVVSFLLNSSLSNKEQQRMTATLLGHIAKYVQVDKVVALLGMLLEDTRRIKLGLQLHKSIVRMLFDNRTATDAKRLLQAEFHRDSATAIRYIMVEKCIETIVKHQVEVDWEWNVLESIAAEADKTSNEVLVNFFAPRWVGCDVNQHVIRFLPLWVENAEKDEILVFLRGKSFGSLCVTNEITREKYHRLLGILLNSISNPTWSILTKVHRLSFAVTSAGVPGDHTDDQTAVDEMYEYLSSSPEDTAMGKFGVEAIATLFGMACSSSLMRDCKKDPELDMKELCDEGGNETAAKFQKCTGLLLNRVLDTPIREEGKRRLTLVALTRMLGMLCQSLGRLRIRDALIESKFEEEIKLLSSDATLVLGSFP